LLAHFAAKNFLYIQQPQSLVVISIEDVYNPVLIEDILTTYDEPFKSFLSARSLVVTKSDKEIKEYSTLEITEIGMSLLDNYQLYGYKLHNDVNNGAALSNFSGLFYRFGFTPDIANPEPVLLVYRTQSQSFNQFYTALDIDITYAEFQANPKIILAVSGRSDTDFVYLNIAGKRFTYRVPVSPKVLVVAGDLFPYFSYNNFITFKYQIFGINAT
jgi:hypothetical protein